MFWMLSLLALLVTPLVSALTVEVPQNPTTGGQITIRWASAAGDPDTWSFELTNEVFHNAFAIANNVDPAPQQLTLTLPVVPVGSGYTIQAVNIGNITDVYASTATFSIGASSASSQSTGSGSSTAVTTRATLSQQTTKVVAPTTTSTTNTGTGTTTDSATTISPSTAAAASSRLGFDLGSMATVTFSIIAGVAILAL